MRRSIFWLCVSGVLWTGCDPKDDEVVDDDGDGIPVEEDCDDSDAAVFPDADELCDGVDNNCDGVIDEDTAVDGLTFYADADADGYGDASAALTACAQPSGTVEGADDCDDTDADIFPGADEYCDGIDNNCDGVIDEDTAVDGLTFYADTDADGYGDPAATTESCEAPAGYVSDDTDCNDADATINPDTVWYADLDADGFGSSQDLAVSCEEPSGYVSDDTDCNDAVDVVYPGAPEVCADGYLNDCDGDADAARDACLWGGALTTADALVFSTTAANFAMPIGPVGDVNGDGYDDAMYGAPWGSSYYGSAHLVAGGPSISDASLDSMPIILGEEFIESVGSSVAGVGDLDGDGYDDILVGSLGTGAGAGSVSLFYGPLSASQSISDAAGQLAGDTSSYLGAAMSMVGDLDGDGADDVLVGAYNYSSSAGQAYLLDPDITGDTGSIADSASAIFTGASSSGLGFSVAGGADFNGDGSADVVIGAYTSGEAFVYYGPLSGSLSASDADITITGTGVGYAVDAMSDLDGDGNDEVVVSAWGDNSSAGRVGVYTGTLVSGALTNAALQIVGGKGSLLGGTLDAMSDIDGDGVEDLLLSSGYSIVAYGSITHPAGDQTAYLYHSSQGLSGLSGTLSLKDADVSFAGTETYYGRIVSGMGDLNGDGAGDLSVSAGYGTENNYLFLSESL